MQPFVLAGKAETVFKIIELAAKREAAEKKLREELKQCRKQK